MGFRRTLKSMQVVRADTTPALMAMIDVVFLLMIFFLFGSVSLRQQQLVTSLARPAAGEPSATAVTSWLTLRPFAQDRVEYRVNGGPWLRRVRDVEAELRVALSQPNSDGALTVDALPGVSFQAVVDALAMGESCGTAAVSLRTD